MPQNVFQVRDMQLKGKQLEYGKQIKVNLNLKFLKFFKN